MIKIGKKNKPFFVAEISANHNGNIKNAFQLIKDAKNFGADAIKLQTYTPSSMTIRSRKKYFLVKKGLWKNYDLWSLYKKAHTPYSWHKKLFNYCKKIGIQIFSTPFDENAVDFLEKLNCPFYKVSSFEMKDLPLIKKIISTGKHIIISTGMASLKEIQTTYDAAIYYGAKKLSLLYCVSNYPSKISDFNMNNIKIMKKKFNCEIGFSDHSNDFRVATSAVRSGATIVEKHISLKNVKALDSDFSISDFEIGRYKKSLQKEAVKQISLKFYNKILGKKSFHRNLTENDSKTYQRSIFTIKKIKKGDLFSIKNLKKVRPGHGVSPIYFDKILGLESPINIELHEPLSSNIISKLKIKKNFY